MLFNWIKKKKAMQQNARLAEQKYLYQLYNKAKSKESEGEFNEIRKQYQQIYSDYIRNEKRTVLEFTLFYIGKPLVGAMPWETFENESNEVSELSAEFNFHPNSLDINKGADAMIATAKLYDNANFNIAMQNNRSVLTFSYVNKHFHQIKESLETAIKCGNIDAVCGMGWYYERLGSHYGHAKCAECIEEPNPEEKIICEQYSELALPYYKFAARLGHTYALFKVAIYYSGRNKEIYHQCLAKLEEMVL